MVAHGHLYVVNAKLAVRNHPKRHVLSVGVLAKSPRQITIEALLDDEFLSGFTKEDKLIPVITITVYLGTKEWDGPRKLSDMFGDVDEELMPFIPDYRINLLAPREITDFTGFRTSIRQLFEVLKNAYDKEKMQEVLQNDEKFSRVDRETVEAINLFAGTDIDIDEKEEVIDMCKAWEEQKNEGRELGREEGRKEGREKKVQRRRQNSSGKSNCFKTSEKRSLNRRYS